MRKESLQALVAPKTPQGVLVRCHAGLAINKLSSESTHDGKGSRARYQTADRYSLHRNVQRFRGGLVFKAHRLCVSLNSRLESNKEEKKKGTIPDCRASDRCWDSLSVTHLPAFG